MSPAPTLVSDFVTWGLVAAVAAAWAICEAARLVYVWRAENQRIDTDLAVMDEQSRRAAETGRWVGIEQAHLGGRHARSGGRGDCVVCGHHDPADARRVRWTE